MRFLLALPLLLAATACNVNNDTNNDAVTLEYNQQQVEETLDDVGNAASEVATGVGNVARSAGDAVQNEVGDIDVDVDVNRNRNTAATTGNSQ